jgi:hypothetical protein
VKTGRGAKIKRGCLWLPRFSFVRDKGSGRFLKKAAQKFLLLWAGGGETTTAQISKVFLLLFVHKK